MGVGQIGEFEGHVTFLACCHLGQAPGPGLYSRSPAGRKGRDRSVGGREKNAAGAPAFRPAAQGLANWVPALASGLDQSRLTPSQSTMALATQIEE